MYINLKKLDKLNEKCHSYVQCNIYIYRKNIFFMDEKAEHVPNV